MAYAMIWMYLDHIVLSKITEPQKGSYHMVTVTSVFKVVRFTETQNGGFLCPECGELFNNGHRGMFCKTSGGWWRWLL